MKNADLDRLLVEGLQTTDVAERHRLNEQVVRDINGELVDIWLFHTPYALIGHDVAGLNFPRVVGFANLEPKPWVGGLWRTDGGPRRRPRRPTEVIRYRRRGRHASDAEGEP
ncbi:MAG: hypothetical protein R2726_08445 [Acidimicrobiales bacterium]